MEADRHSGIKAKLRCFFSIWILRVTAVLCLSADTFAHGTTPDYDELLIFFHVDLIGSTEVPAVIRGRELYLPVVDVFHFVGIKAVRSGGNDLISGFFAGVEDRYIIDGINSSITYRGKTYPLSPRDLIRTETNLYLKSDYFDQVFGLECRFSFRNLSVSLRSQAELPAIRQARLEKMRLNVSRLKREFIPDTAIGRRNALFHLGAVDWAVNGRQDANGIHNTLFNLSVGANLAGGELIGRFNYNTHYPLMERNHYYRWRYANNDRHLLRQVTAGKIATQSISSIFRPVVGVQISNTPTYRKTSFGSYTIHDYTQPGWTVELYINNALVDYVKADATGFFRLEVPLIYGSTKVTLRYHGLWGEEQVSTKEFNIPYMFLPVNALEYTVSSGIVEDGERSLFSQARINYGLLRNVTVGGGLEYLSSVSQGKYIPFLNTSIRMAPNLIVSGEYASGVRSTGKLSYFSPSRLRFELNHTQYEQAQEAVRYAYTKETEAIVGLPFRLFNASFVSQVALSRNFMLTNQYDNARFELSGSARGVTMNMSTVVRAMSESEPHVYSEFSSSLMLPAQFIFNTRTRYEHNMNRFSYLQLGLKRDFSGRGAISVAYERNVPAGLNMFRVGLSYNFSFASLIFSSSHSKNGVTLFEGASGGFSHEPRSGYVNFNRRRNTGLGGLILMPFLDLNANEKRDANEPNVKGVNVKGNGGHIEKNTEDGTIVISGLEPFSSYFLELNGDDLDNIAWRINRSALSVVIEPNRIRAVEIPVAVAGEASGMVYLQAPGGSQGIGRVKVGIYDSQERLVANVLSGPDGFFSYLGLLPGTYIARPDPVQMQELELASTPAHQSFEIRQMEEGDYVDHLEFVIEKSKENDPASTEAPDALYSVLLMATHQPISIHHPVFKNLEDVQMHYHESMYKYTWGEVTSIEAARILVNELKARGFTTALEVHLFSGEGTIPTTGWQDSPDPAETVQKNELAYKLQILATREYLPVTHLVFKGLEDVQVYYHDGMYKYTWGSVSTLEKARILENHLKQGGFTGTFIVFFEGDRRMTQYPEDLWKSGPE